MVRVGDVGASPGPYVREGDAPGEPTSRAIEGRTGDAAPTVADATVTAPRRDPEVRATARARTAELDRQLRARIESTAPTSTDAPTSAGGPRYAYDVRMSDADRAKLPRDQAEAVRRARDRYRPLLDRGYQVTLTESAGNAGRPVVVIQPPGFDPSKPVDVHTHYHGNGGSAYGDGHPGTKQTRAIEEVTRANPQSVFVLPVSGPGDNGNQWRGVSQARTTQDALIGLERTIRARDPNAPALQVGTKTASFHSAAHAALASSASTKGGLDADRIELLDCLTGASVDALVRWKSEGRTAEITIHEGAPSGLQSGDGAVARERALVRRLEGAGAHLASKNEDHYDLVYRHLQGNVRR